MKTFHFSNGKLTNMFVMEKWNSRQSLLTSVYRVQFRNGIHSMCNFCMRANLSSVMQTQYDGYIQWWMKELLWILSTPISVFYLLNQSVSCPILHILPSFTLHFDVSTVRTNFFNTLSLLFIFRKNFML